MYKHYKVLATNNDCLNSPLRNPPLISYTIMSPRGGETHNATLSPPSLASSTQLLIIKDLSKYKWWPGEILTSENVKQ